jgi:glycosyltransferase involved in cell wall biosynthesis
MERKRVCLIINIISPYRISLFNHLSRMMELKVIFLAESEENRNWKVCWDEIEFDYTVLKGGNLFIKRFEIPLYLNFGLFKELRRYNPDSVVICGYHYPATWLSILYARHYKKKIILWAGSHLQSGFLKNRLTDLYKKMIIPCFDSYVTYGTAAKEQIVYYGADERKISIGCNTVDVNSLISKSKGLDRSVTEKLRNSFSNQNILYVGSFIPRKGVMQLIKVFELLRNEVEDVGLILVGDGPDKESYRAYIRENNIQDVYFPGFVQKEEIVKYFLLSDCLVLPSYKEVWGLVVNEAMACGVPTVVSKYCGSSYDLIKDGENGYVIDPEDIVFFKRRLKDIISDSQLRSLFRERSLELISTRGLEQYAGNILEAVNAVS